jgi:hypothetical protein
MTKTTILTAVALVVTLRAVNGTLPPITPGEIVAMSLFGLLLWWCLTPSRRSRAAVHANDAGSGEEPRKSVAFRLGKALNRVLYRRVHPVVTDDLR